ncbi:MAG: VOC family protein [Actinomycetota bacterium]
MAESTESQDSGGPHRALPLTPGRYVDHIVWGAPDTDAAIETLEDLTGVRARIGSMPTHADYPTRSASIGLGNGAFFEIYGPNPNYRGPENFFHALLTGLTEPRLLTWFVRVDDLPAVLDHLAERGHDGRLMIDQWERTEAASFRNAQITALALDPAAPRIIEWNDRQGMDAKLGAELTLRRLRIASDDAAVGRVHDALGLDAATDIDLAPGATAFSVELQGPGGPVTIT